MDKAARDPEPKVDAEYFETAPGDPSIFDLVIAIEAIAKAQEAMSYSSMSVDDIDEVERLGDLGIAAAILARQLRRRHLVCKPPSKRRKPKPRLEVVA